MHFLKLHLLKTKLLLSNLNKQTKVSDLKYNKVYSIYIFLNAL